MSSPRGRESEKEAKMAALREQLRILEEDIDEQNFIQMDIDEGQET